MPALLARVISGGLTVLAWYFAGGAIKAGADGLAQSGKVLNAPAVQLAAIAAVIYSGAVLLHETKGRR